MYPDSIPKPLSPFSKILRILLVLYCLILFGRYIGSIGISSSQTFSLDAADFVWVTFVSLFQCISLILLRYTQLEFFKKLFIVSQFIAMALDLTGIGYISGSEIYGGFIENLNKLAALISFVALLTHAYLVFYIWGQSVKHFLKDVPKKTQTSSWHVIIGVVAIPIAHWVRRNSLPQTDPLALSSPRIP